MEYAMMDALVDKCMKSSQKEIWGYYYPTPKNSMVKNFYGDMGFKKVTEGEEGSSWKLVLDGSYRSKNKHIQVEVEK